MKWLKFETHEEEEVSDPENSYILVYLGPEALKHAVIVEDFGTFYYGILKNLAGCGSAE